MAKQKINGRASRVAPASDSGIVLSQAQQVTAAAGVISRIAEEVAEGADQQLRTLERATGRVNEMATSLKETASQAGQRASYAQEQADQAEQERAQAEEARQRADEVDPDVAT